MKKETYDITGMSCAACSARIEKGISGMEGMQQCSVNLLKNSMTVSYDEAELDSGKIIHQVEDIGYGASLHQTQGSKTTGASGRGKNGATDAAAAAAKQMKQRLIVSLVFTIPLFYISMGHMAGWPLPSWLLGARNHMIFAFTQFLLVLPVLIAGGHYFKNGLKNLWHRSPNMDSLIALGSGAAFVYGIYAIYKIAWGFSIEDMDMVETFGMNLYFESSAMILTLITLGKFMEARAKSKTSEAITKLMDLAPKTAKVLRNGQEEEISVDDVQNGDILVVRDGDTVPVDGKITPYFAYDMEQKYVYKDLYTLLAEKKPSLLSGYVEWQKIDSNNEIVVRNTELTDLAVLVTDKKIYSASKIIKSIQYLLFQDVVREWNDKILRISNREETIGEMERLEIDNSIYQSILQSN